MQGHTRVLLLRKDYRRPPLHLTFSVSVYRYAIGPTIFAVILLFQDLPVHFTFSWGSCRLQRKLHIQSKCRMQSGVNISGVNPRSGDSVVSNKSEKDEYLAWSTLQWYASVIAAAPAITSSLQEITLSCKSKGVGMTWIPGASASFSLEIDLLTSVKVGGFSLMSGSST